MPLKNSAATSFCLHSRFSGASGTELLCSCRAPQTILRASVFRFWAVAARAAEAEAAAEMQRAQAAERRYAVDAAGRAALNDADNRLSAEIVQMRLRLALIEQMRDIIRESVKPLENIDSIKILQVDGLANGAAHDSGAGSPSDQIVQSALKYRAQAPLIDSLLKELGFDGSSPTALASALDRQAGGIRTPATVAVAGSNGNGKME
jgi:uncharacterized membrane protein YqiK